MSLSIGSSPRKRWAVSYKYTVVDCVLLTTWMSSTSAEIITVPFGCKAGQVRVYGVATRMVRLGDLQGANCTLNGRLRIEVTGRDGIYASKSAPVLEDSY